LLISRAETDTGLKQVPKTGFFVDSVLQSGNCVPAGTHSAFPLRLDFNDDMQLTCQVAESTLSDFQTFCETADNILDYQIMAQFESWEYVGVFGNADVTKKQDWVPVIKDDFTTMVGIYDPIRQSCFKETTVIVEILYSEAGYADDS
jgi:hypothetical protein